MSNTQDPVIEHYTSKYYDPEKAREYYLRNRELTGRRSGSDLKTEGKKQGWSYAKSQIDKEKHLVSDKANTKQKQELVKLQNNAQLKRLKISEDLKNLMAKLDKANSDEKIKLSNKRAEEVQRIAEEASRKISGLPPIPKGLSKEKTAELAAERSAAIAKIRGDAKSERENVAVDSAKKLGDLATGISALKGSAQGSANLNREKVASDIKGSLEQARKKYTVLKEAVKAKYEAKYQAEYDAIKQNA